MHTDKAHRLSETHKVPFITSPQHPVCARLTMDMDLRPLEVKLAALVTLEVNLGFFGKITKTLFKANIFRYQAPTINRRVLSVGKKEEDNTPPQFVSFEEDQVCERVCGREGWGGRL